MVKRQKPRKETFTLGPSHLNLEACPAPLEALPTKELIEALAYVRRLHMSQDELMVADSHIPSAVYDTLEEESE